MMKPNIKHSLSLLFSIVMVFYFVKPVEGQVSPPPDIVIPFDTGIGAPAGTYNFPAGNGFDNRTAGGVTWTLEFQSSASPTVTFQSSLGVASPTSYGAYTGTTIFSGTGIATYSNLQSGTVVDTPWVRVHVVTSGSGQTKGVLYGYKTGYTGGTGGGGGGGGGSGCPNPCPVLGTGTAGTANVGVVTIQGIASMTPVSVTPTSSANACPNPCPVNGSAAVGSAAANPVTTGTRDDSNNVLADHSFPSQAAVTGSSVTALKVIAGVSAKLTYVGHVSFLMNTGTTYQFVQGTTVSTPCDTGQAAVSGVYQTSTGIALDFTPFAAMHTTVNANDLCVLFGASVTVGGLLEYSQR